jgi:hypothetical protein
MAQNLRAYLANRRTRLPKLLSAAQAAAQIEHLHREHGGATFSLYFANVAGQELVAVSLYPERSVKVRGRFVPTRRLQAFVAQNQDLLHDPRNAVGTWYNEDNDTTYLDVTATLPDREQAVALGRAYNQIAIYDLFRDEEIETGGTGEPRLDAPPETDRLPQPIR